MQYLPTLYSPGTISLSWVAGDGVADLDEEEIWQYGEFKASAVLVTYDALDRFIQGSAVFVWGAWDTLRDTINS
jgi:hypothetical protein